jgi:hypothetical protein
VVQEELSQAGEVGTLRKLHARRAAVLRDGRIDCSCLAAERGALCKLFASIS